MRALYVHGVPTVSEKNTGTKKKKKSNEGDKASRTPDQSLCCAHKYNINTSSMHQCNLSVYDGTLCEIVCAHMHAMPQGGKQ
jgi:hypothetical protein